MVVIRRLIRYLNIMKYLVIAALLLTPLNAHAIRQYRCANKVQYYPCDQILFKDFRHYSAKGDIRARMGDDILGERYAEVTEAKFTPLNTTEGKWKGKIKGNGKVSLKLLIIREGTPDMERPMGATYLRDQETTFAFISALPPGRNWKWEITAAAS